MQADQTTETSRASRSKETSKSNTNEAKTTGMAKGIKGSNVANFPGQAYGAPRSYGTHKGVDISMPYDTELIALCDGVIAASQTSGWYSNPTGAGLITIKSTVKVGPFPPGTMFGYGHAHSTNVNVGDKVSAGKVIGRSGLRDEPHLHFFINTSGVAGGNGDTDPTALAKALLDGAQLPIDSSGSPTGSGDPTQPSSDVTDPMGAALFGSLAIPSMMEMTEAVLLGGQKSYMNDKPLLPFIQQLCNASLRHFQSLPDGRFYAFYPDYFGEVNAHPPYWEIDDIEILDGSIQLSDDSLITHMYVMGDTINPIMGSPEALRALASSGVVTVYNMFSADSVLNQTESSKQNRSKTDKDKKDDTRERALKRDPLSGVDSVLDGEQVKEFLNRYGVRPVVEDMPAIRSPWYEMFLAYQKFMLGWSRQFLTPFSFTFMPELYPGGKVGFPDHALQMYIEEVEHVFDYESGFTTNAALTAPSVYKSASTPSKADNVLPDRMVNAIIGPIVKSASSTGSTYKPSDVPKGKGANGQIRPT